MLDEAKIYLQHSLKKFKNSVNAVPSNFLADRKFAMETDFSRQFSKKVESALETCSEYKTNLPSSNSIYFSYLNDFLVRQPYNKPENFNPASIIFIFVTFETSGPKLKSGGSKLRDSKI